MSGGQRLSFAQVCQQQASETRLTLTDVATTFLVVVIGCAAALGLFLFERATLEASLLLREALGWWHQGRGAAKLNKKSPPKVVIE